MKSTLSSSRDQHWRYRTSIIQACYSSRIHNIRSFASIFPISNTNNNKKGSEAPQEKQASSPFSRTQIPPILQLGPAAQLLQAGPRPDPLPPHHPHPGLQQIRMPPPKRQHDPQHQNRVKHVQGPLVPQQEPILAHGELGDPEQAPHHDQRANPVQHEQQLLPALGRLAFPLPVRDSADAVMVVPPVEHPGSHAKESKHYDLNQQAPDDHLLPHV